MFSYNAKKEERPKVGITPLDQPPQMRYANKLGRQASRSFLRQSQKAVRPDHAAFHSTRKGLGA